MLAVAFDQHAQRTADTRDAGRSPKHTDRFVPCPASRPSDQTSAASPASGLFRPLWRFFSWGRGFVSGSVVKLPTEAISGFLAALPVLVERIDLVDPIQRLVRVVPKRLGALHDRVRVALLAHRVQVVANTVEQIGSFAKLFVVELDVFEFLAGLAGLLQNALQLLKLADRRCEIRLYVEPDCHCGCPGNTMRPVSRHDSLRISGKKMPAQSGQSSVVASRNLKCRGRQTR
ncbi:MAG: hypothetical protein MUF20_03185 [Methylotetracoccus sp.]|nr:hypothetical protein [Methylotetracoccus sp.]